MRDNTQALDCVENGAGTCRNADLIEQLRADLAAARAALEAELDAARAERNTLWAYVSSVMTITNHEEYCEVCGHNDVPCADKKRLEADKMRAFDAVMKIVAK